MKDTSLLNIWLKNFLFSGSIVLFVLGGCIFAWLTDRGPFWVLFIPLVALVGLIHLCVRKRKIMLTWPHIKGNLSRREITLKVWEMNYRRTLIYTDFIKWYTPRKKTVWQIMFAWFVLGFAAVALHFLNVFTVWVPTWVLGSWGVVVFLFAVVLGIDKFWTYRSMSVIKEILHQRGINYESIETMKTNAIAQGFEPK